MTGLARENGNITFYHPGRFEEENIKKMYKLFFGTNLTNPDLYELYPADMFPEEDIIGIEEGEFTEPTKDEEGNYIGEYFYCPSQNSPLVFTYRKIVDGVSKPADYYIQYDSGNNQYLLTKTPNSSFPSSDFYMHFVNDRSSLTDLEIDEKTLNAYMKDKKISGMDLYYAKPYFKGYDIKATVYYDANFTEANIRSLVEQALKDLCSIEKADIGGYMSQAKIIKEIMAIDGVENVTINFFGYDFTSTESSSAQLNANFYEILSLNDFEEGKHGILFDYEIQS